MKQRQPVASEMDLRPAMLLAITFVSCFICSIADVTEPCKDCARQKRLTETLLSPEELRRARIELIKKQILDKLRLQEPPKVNISSIPSIITNSVLLRNPNDEVVIHDKSMDEYYGTTQNIVLLTENISTDNCPQASSQSICLSFNIHNAKISDQSIASAYLWTYRNRQNNRNLTYTTYNIQYKNESVYWQRVLRLERIDSANPGWYKTDITQTLSDWPDQYQIFQIDCDECEHKPIAIDSDNRPFIVINTDASTHVSRNKRSVDCTGSSTGCCREQLYISFDEIGWDDWILQPPGYTANYCKGSCLQDASLNRYHHTTVIQQYLQRKKAKNETTELKLCCSPSRLSSISLIFIDEEDSIFERVLPNMVVEACDCV